MIKKVLLIAIIIFFYFPGSGFSQAEDKQNMGTWLTYRNRLKINSKFYYIDDFSFRHTLFYDKWQRFTFNPAVVFNATNNLEIFFGFANHFVIQDLISNSFEIRVWQGAKISWPSIKRFHFNHLFRFEERNIYEFDDKTWDTGYRARYRLGLTIPINNSALIENVFYAGINAEAYGSIKLFISERYIDKARYGAILGYRKNLKWTFELMYIFDDSKEFQENNFELNNHMIRIRLINVIKI